MLQFFGQPEALLIAVILMMAGLRLFIDLNWIYVFSQGRKRHWMQAVAASWVIMGAILAVTFWVLH